MVNLTDYFVGPTDTEMRLQVKKVIYVTVGDGKYTTFNPTEVGFSGQVNAFGYDTSFDFNLTITGDSSCTLALSGNSQDATYYVDGGYLNIDIPSGREKGTLQIENWDGGVWIDLDVPGGHVIWIGP